jgi:hypothetical protein
LLASTAINTATANAIAALDPARNQLHHAAIHELLRLLRPQAPAVPPPVASVTCDACVLSDSDDGPVDATTLGLSIEKPWDWEHGGQAGTGTQAGGAVRGKKSKGRGGGGKPTGGAAAGAKRRERTRRERFMDVETFWRTCPPEQRRALLQVPLVDLLQGEEAMIGG